MGYKRKPPPSRRDNETDRQYIQRLIATNPRGYSGWLRFSLPEIYAHIQACNGNAIGEKTYCWLYGIATPPQCRLQGCSSTTNFKQLSHGYYDFCSTSCRAKYNESFKNGITDSANQKRIEWRQGLSSDQKTQMSNKIKQGIFKSQGDDFYQRLAADNKNRLSLNRPRQLNDTTWLSEQLQQKTIAAVADELNVSWDMVRNAATRFDIPLTYHTTTSVGENQMCDFLRSCGVDVQQSVRYLIAPHELDIFLPQYNVAIEYCGLYWHSTSVRPDKNYHITKFAKCKDRDIKLITVFEDEWKCKPDVVKDRIRHIIGLSDNKCYARQTTIVELTKYDSKLFFETQHMQGNAGHKVCYGLVHHNQVVAAMSFGKPRYNKNAQYELIRFATNGSVIGAGSKLFKHFVKHQQPNSVVSYADNRWGIGDFYNHLGFVCHGQTPPSYFYFKDGENKKHHRSQFMKHKIINDMNGDPTLTEFENMRSMGYHRIYDCGTTKYLWCIDSRTT